MARIIISTIFSQGERAFHLSSICLINLTDFSLLILEHLSFFKLKVLFIQSCSTRGWIVTYQGMEFSRQRNGYPFLSPGDLDCHRGLDQDSLHHTAIPLAIYFKYGNVYTFQCYSLKSSHLLFPPLCLKVDSLCLCLLCYSANGIISTIFLCSIFMCVLIYIICFSLSELLHSV